MPRAASLSFLFLLRIHQIKIVIAGTEAVPLKQRHRNRKETAMIINLAPDQESAMEEMAENEKADKDFSVDAAADDRNETLEEISAEMITRFYNRNTSLISDNSIDRVSCAAAILSIALEETQNWTGCCGLTISIVVNASIYNEVYFFAFFSIAFSQIREIGRHLRIPSITIFIHHLSFYGTFTGVFRFFAICIKNVTFFRIFS